jgi:hypothetical protein
VIELLEGAMHKVWVAYIAGRVVLGRGRAGGSWATG